MEAEYNMKRLAGEFAAGFVRDGMKVGLGTGSTAYYAIIKIGEMVRAGLDIQAVATSRASEKLAAEHGIPLTPVRYIDWLDLTIDGADELDDDLRLIKGGGGALLREKMTAYRSRKFLVIADDSKRVAKLGAFPLPVEIVPFACEWTTTSLEQLGCAVQLRRTSDGEIDVTDNGNYIADCSFGEIDMPEEIADRIRAIPGVVEHGLFLGMADLALIGCRDGSVRTIHAPIPPPKKFDS